MIRPTRRESITVAPQLGIWSGRTGPLTVTEVLSAFSTPILIGAAAVVLYLWRSR